MKVFVTLGTQKQQFTRLLKMLEDSEELKACEILVQAGHTKYESKRLNIVEFMGQDSLNDAIRSADLVITHGGVGSIIAALKFEKKVLAIPRLSKYAEHVDDHQIEICKELTNEGYILYLDDSDLFDDKIKQLKENSFKKYVSDDSFLDILRKEI